MSVAGRRSIEQPAIGFAGIALTALWLWRGPSIIGDLVATNGGAAADAVFTVLMFLPLLVIALVGGSLTRIPALAAGIHAASAAGRGTGIGLGGLFLATLYAAFAGSVQRGTGSALNWGSTLGLFVVGLQAGIEEVLFRGWLQPLFARWIGTYPSIATAAAVFALLHTLAGGIDAVVLLNLLLGGLLFGVLAAHDGGIAGAAAAHIAYNAAEQLLLGLDPNPGVGSFHAAYDLDLIGPVRWGGSDAGLNASWAMTFALVVMLVPLVVRWRFIRKASRAASV